MGRQPVSFTADQIDEIYRLYVNDGMSINNIAAKYNVGFYTMQNIVKKFNVKRVFLQRSEDEKEKIREKVRELYQDGYTQTFIRKTLHVGRDTVVKAIGTDKPLMRGNRPVSPDMAEKMMRLYAEGMPLNEIAVRTGYSTAAVKKWTFIGPKPSKKEMEEKNGNEPFEKRKWTDEQRIIQKDMHGTIMALYVAGWSIDEISNDPLVCRHPESVQKVINHYERIIKNEQEKK